MPFARSSSPMRWMLPMGAVGLGLLAFVPAGANVTQDLVRADVVSAVLPPQAAAISPVSAPSAAPEIVAAAPATPAPAPTWLAALKSPRPYAVAKADETWVPKGAELPVAAPLVDAPAQPQLVARTGLNVRAAPSTDSARVAVLQPRQQVAVIEAGDDWTHVRTTDGVEGWAYTPLLADPSEPIKAAPKPPRREVTVAVSGGDVTYEAPRRKRTTLLDYLNGRGMLRD